MDNKTAKVGKSDEPSVFRRVMLKLSGEALAGEKHFGFDDDVILAVADEVKSAVCEGVQLAIVIGGGNFWRGRQTDSVDRYKADQVGMLATIMNCIYVSELFRTKGMRTYVCSALKVDGVVDLFSKDRAIRALDEGNVVFLAGGTGHPYFSTDTGVVLRAIELECQEILLAKSIDGVYNADPKLDPEAKRYDKISISRMIDERLMVIDLAASVMCLENHMPLSVFSLMEKGGITEALKGNINGTKITAD